MSRLVRHDWFLSRVRPGRCQATNRRATASSFPFFRRLRIEPLEDRRLLAAVTVNTILDTFDSNDGLTSLREAIFATNLVGGADTIEFAGSLTSAGAATILLTHGELKITDALAINGPGANLLTIDASGNDPTPDSTLDDGNATNDGDGSRVFNIDDGNDANLLDVSISGLTLTGGDVNGDGGAIFTRENLSVTSSTISGNLAVGHGGIGGGIWADGNVTVTSSTISGNSADHGSGGISASGNVTVTGSTFSGNSVRYGNGGGISAGGDVTVTSSTIAGNSARGNFGGGGFAGRGGGISAGGDVTVTSSTISGNSARANGGGIYARGDATVASSTISGNSALGVGGGIYAEYGDVTVTSSTISGNSANYGGIGASLGPVTITNSIVAGNTSNAGSPDLMPGTGVLSVHYSLIGDNTGTALIEAPVGAPDANGNLIGGPVGGVIDPRLAPLANNGGPTQTQALLPGSPAIDAGDPAAVAGMGGVPLYDQRGAPWSRVVGGRLDIGAVESQPNPLPGDYNFNGLVDAADYCVWRDTLGSTTDLRADGNGNGVVDQPDYARWRADFGNTRPPAAGVGSMLSMGASSGEAAAARSAPADNASPITASAQAVDRALAELGGSVPVRGSERFALAIHADRRMAARQADANLLLLAVARSAAPDADADDRLGAPAHDKELDAARQFERWGEVGIEWDVGPSSLRQQLVNA